jgi:hypothetical protein
MSDSRHFDHFFNPLNCMNETFTNAAFMFPTFCKVANHSFY